MPKTPLSPSPLDILQHEFLEIALRSTPLEKNKPFGDGLLEVEREDVISSKDQRTKTLFLKVTIGRGKSEDNPPPYEGQVTIRGAFRVHENYTHDADQLIRITGASILYGAVREMLANLTARSANGMISLPSVSFVETSAKKTKPKKRILRPVKQ